MKVLVTGATGFLGKWLVQRLALEGLAVRILRRKSSRSDFTHPAIEDFWGDVTDLESVNAACKDVHTVFHLAGVVGYSRGDRDLMESVNVGGTANVLTACQGQRVNRLVHMSSVVAVGASFDGQSPLTEESPYNLRHLNLGYFETKRMAEELVVTACKNGLTDAVILNPSTIYGPGDAAKGSRKVQLKVARGKFPFYTGGGVSIIGVDEVIEATIAAWKKGRSGERYILSGENITIKQLFDTISSAAGVPAPKIGLPNLVVKGIGLVGDQLERLGKKGPLNSESAWSSILYHWFDSKKARQELGLNPKPARVSIEKSVTWIKEQGLLKL